MSKNQDYKNSVVLLKSDKANNDYDIWTILNERWSSYTIVNSRRFDLETPYNRGWVKEGITIDVYLLHDIETNKYYWDTNYVSIKKAMSKNVVIMCLESGRFQLWTIEEILSEINRDRSEHWTDYDESDWHDGWMEWCEGDSYSLICEVGDKVIINNIDGDHVGYNGEEVEVKGCVDTGYLIVGDGWWCSLGEVAFVMEGGESC